MNDVLQKIIDKVNAAEGKEDFLTVLFGHYKKEALDKRPVVLFGAGALGMEMLYALKQHGVTPVCFCDNDSTKHGKVINNIPVISFSELKQRHRNSLIVLGLTNNMEYVTNQLKSHGFDLKKVFRKETDIDTDLLAMYSMVGSQSLFVDYKNASIPNSILDKLLKMEMKIKQAHDAYYDTKSKELYIMKLAVFASNMHFYLFKEFMLLFSEPIHKFGMLNYEGTPEDYFYFNNDVLTLSPNEIYVDVGAFDGDTIETFVQACSNKGVNYRHIYGFEPDPVCFKRLEKNIVNYANVSIHQIGLWSESKTLKFVPSVEAIHDQAAKIIDDGAGSVEIKVSSLDDFLDGQEVTFIKMDPSGDIINEVIVGATYTISEYKPKLALGIYHSLEEFVDIPITLKNLCPDYKLFLRHNTYHLCDTDLYAYV